MNARHETDIGDVQHSLPTQILVVDDETSIFDGFEMMFPKPRYALAVASDGSRAVELALAQPFDVAFVDCFLGTEDGIEVAQKLHRVRPDLNVVLMSGYLRDENSEATEKAGARAFLNKPFSFETARGLVRRLIGQKRPAIPRGPASEVSRA
jgi:DNA-binding NtrC family response regulator